MSFQQLLPAVSVQTVFTEMFTLVMLFFNHRAELSAFLHSYSACSHLAGLSSSLFLVFLFAFHLFCARSSGRFPNHIRMSRFGFCLSSLSICETGVGKSIPVKFRQSSVG